MGDLKFRRLYPLGTQQFADTVLDFTDADGYTNHYAVLQSANQRKRRRERAFADSAFFDTRFFQPPGGFDERIEFRYPDCLYYPRDPADEEAQAFIDYLELSDEEPQKERRRRIHRIRETIDAAGYDAGDLRDFFRRNPEESHFPTALEAAFGFDPSLDRG